MLTLTLLTPFLNILTLTQGWSLLCDKLWTDEQINHCMRNGILITAMVQERILQMKRSTDIHKHMPRPLAENFQHILRHHTFRQTLLLEGIALVLLVFFLFSWGIRHSYYVNDQVLSDLNQGLSSYVGLLQRVSDMDRIPQSNVSSLWRHDIMDDYYRTRFSSDFHADLYLLSPEGVPFLSSTETLTEKEVHVLHMAWKNMMTETDSFDPLSGKIHAVITRGRDRSLLLCRAVPATGGWAMVKCEEFNFASCFASEAVKNALSDREGWALSPDQSAPLDSLHQIRTEFTAGTGLHMIPGAVYFSVTRSLADADLFLYSFWNLTPILFFLGLIILSTLLIMILIMRLSQRDTRSLADEFSRDILVLKDALQEACQGNLEQTVVTDSSAELADIGRAYNHMLRSLKKQMEDNEALARVVADEQVKQLGSQFTAHFLFNTLDNIHYLCRSAPELAESMIISLSDLLRYNTHSPGDKVTLIEDFYYIRIYLKILKIRFGDAFTFSLDLEEGLEDYLILKLLIQPILENSLKYGRIHRDVLDIRVQVRQEGGHILLVCQDNGEGISEERLRRIRQNLAKEENSSSHLGLYNLHRRIQLTYGAGYGIQLSNVHGLRVTVRIPREREYEE